MQSILGEVEKGTDLKHVEVNDKAAPVIENITLKENPFKKVATDLTEPHELKHVDQINDKSAPLIDSDAHIKPNHRNELMTELKKRTSESD